MPPTPLVGFTYYLLTGWPPLRSIPWKWIGPFSLSVCGPFFIHFDDPNRSYFRTCQRHKLCQKIGYSLIRFQIFVQEHNKFTTQNPFNPFISRHSKIISAGIPSTWFLTWVFFQRALKFEQLRSLMWARKEPTNGQIGPSSFFMNWRKFSPLAFFSRK